MYVLGRIKKFLILTQIVMQSGGRGSMLVLPSIAEQYALIAELRRARENAPVLRVGFTKDGFAHILWVERDDFFSRKCPRLERIMTYQKACLIIRDYRNQTAPYFSSQIQAA